MRRIIFWIRNARPMALPQSLIPGITALVLAAGKSGFSIWLGVLAMFGVSMAHLSLNLFDDFFDYRKKESGYRDTLAREGIRARTVKCPYLQSGEVTMKQLFFVAVVFGCLAVMSGGLIFLFRGWFIAGLAGVTAVIGLSYSGGPLSLSYHGFGELVVGVLFGPFLMIGIDYSACGQFDRYVVWLGIAMGMLVANVLYTHSILDYEADIRAGKHTLATVLSEDWSRYLVSIILTTGPCVIVYQLVLTDLVSRWYLLTLLILPWSAELLFSIWKHLEVPYLFVKPKGFWGPMENWGSIEAEGIDWFMFRWYLSRNILIGFGVLCIVAAVLSK